MARLVLDLKKSIEENASGYFEKSKKLKKKIQGAEEALKKNYKRLRELEAKKEKEEAVEEKKEKSRQRKRRWYEKFRWFFSSDNFLVVGGRDATSNEVLIKKHADKEDLVFHTDMAGSPFFVVKTEGKEVSGKTIREAADATCTFSKTWQLGLKNTEVFYVKPEQVSKKAKSGEFLGKGAFMIYGKTTYVDNKVNLAIGFTKSHAPMAGPAEAVKSHCGKFVVLEQGDEKVSSIAKKVNAKLGNVLELDEIIRLLPSGNFKITKIG